MDINQYNKKGKKG